MQYTLKLRRFEMDFSKLKSKLKEADKNIVIQKNDSEIIIDTELLETELKKFSEIEKISKIQTIWKPFSSKTLKEDLLASARYNTYQLQINFQNKIPMSKKSLYKRINPYLKHERKLFSETSPNIIVIDIKKDKEIKYRISTKTEVQQETPQINNIIIALESPTLKEEIQDILRIAYIFKIPIAFINAKKQLIESAKKAEKGIPYKDLIILEELPKEYALVGFSRHAYLNEENFLETYKSKEKVCLVFGNEKFGLSQDLRDKMNYIFRLQNSTKPFKASQAVSYVMGLIVGGKI